MKKLWVIRHAKSSWNLQDQPDFDRPLNKRGLLSAEFMSKLMKNSGCLPDAIVSSPANRARTTAEIFQKNLGLKKVFLNPDIYVSHFTKLANITTTFNDEWNSVMLFGHNPGMSELVTYLSGEDCELVTCAIADLDLNIDSWKASSNGVANLNSVDYPKNHAKFVALLNE